MQLKILLLFLLFYGSCVAQQTLTPKQINRLADAGKIYGYVKYFHPWLQYKNIDWDSAFAANVEAIINAKDKNDYMIALQQSFSVLNDGLTSVANRNGSSKGYKEQELNYYIKDSLLYIQINDAPFMTTDDKLDQALKNLQYVRGAIIDMRRPVNSRYYDMLGNGAYFDWNSSFFTGSYKMPSMRTVTYSDFPSEWGAGYNNVAFRENVLSVASGNASREVPLVFIISREDEIPLVAIKLQEKEKCKILKEEGKQLIPGTSIHFYITDSVLVQMRTGEAINTDASLLEVHANDTFNSSDDSTTILKKAKNLIQGNNVFARERKWEHPLPIEFPQVYPSISFPSVGYRMVAAAKMFSIIDHFYASKKGMTKNWKTAYREAIPTFIAAKDSVGYWRAVAQLHAFTQDSHGFIAMSTEGFSLRLNPIIQDRGAFMPPVFTAIIENRVLVTGIFNDSVCKKIGLATGDIILLIDGKDPKILIEQARKYQNAGNRGSQDFYLGSFVLFGKKGEIKKLKVQDAKGSIKQINMPTLGEFKGNWLQDKYVSGIFSYNREATVRYLPESLVYVDLTSGLKNQNIDSVIKWLGKAKGLIVDIRGYPQGVSLPIESIFQDKLQHIIPKIVYTVSGNLPASKPKVISVDRFNTYVPAEQYQTEYRTTNKNFTLPVRLVMLINGAAQSQGDYIPFIYKTNYNATIIGSPTAGAMTAFTTYKIPGNISLWLSWRAINRKGIQPDIFVQPTVKGIQAGKDEVLGRAIKYLQTGQ